MLKEWLASTDLLSWPVAAMLFFLGFFIAVIVWTMAKSRKEHYRNMANIPLDGAETPGGTRGLES